MILHNKILVIGSNCFSGASFADHCLSLGYKVIGISRSEEYPSIFLPYKNNNSLKNFEFIQADLNKDSDRITHIIQDNKIPIIVNFAAQGMVGESWQNPIHWFTTNTLGHITLHNKIKNFDFIKKYVHISTPEVYGSCEGIVKEDHPFNPSTPYAVSKAACDLSLKTFHKTYNFPVVWTRASNVYGAYQALYRIIPKTIFSILAGKKLPLHGGGHSVRSFIHIKDIASATLKIAEESPIGEVYHISTNRFVSIRDLVKMICEILNVKFEDSVEITEDRPGKDAAYTLDSNKIRQKLNWNDKISLEEGIEETIQWVESNFEELKKYPDYYIHKQ
ncbi:MAG: GDP-mannose 4,6-dehydratase [Leptospiraceae bacterium]|nr:GDP-mannose 4,6-dehydratase [Leptospiraceae bacterium]